MFVRVTTTGSISKVNTFACKQVISNDFTKLCTVYSIIVIGSVSNLADPLVLCIKRTVFSLRTTQTLVCNADTLFCNELNTLKRVVKVSCTDRRTVYKSSKTSRISCTLNNNK